MVLKVLRTQIGNINQSGIQADSPAESFNFAPVDIGQAGTNQDPIGCAFINQLLQMFPSVGSTGLLEKIDAIDQRISLELLNHLLGIDRFRKSKTTHTNDHQDPGYFSQHIG